MDGFDDALAGYYDPRDQVTRYVHARVDEHAAEQRAATAALDSPSDVEARRERVREQWLSSIGGLPARPSTLAVETAGRIEQDGYTIEKVSVESRPSFHVTANCYVPAGEGPHPSVLFLCGHVDEGKADAMNQRACIELATNGFVVLVVDPVCQGERRQYHDDDGDQVFAGSGGTLPHCYAGQRCIYAGTNLARYVTHDNRCALDYLVGREDVDRGHVGVAGTSGGGVQAQYLMLVDDRLDAAALCCSVTDRREWLQTGKRIDAEQLVYGAFPRGIGYDDFASALAPKPVFVGAAASDQYFPIEGVRDAFNRIGGVYDACDASEAVAFSVADTTHCSVYEIGAPVFEFLASTLGAGDYRPVDDHAVLDADELAVTPEGSVTAAHADERTIDDLIRDDVTDDYPAGVDSEPEPATVRRAVADTLDADRDGCDLHPRFVDRDDVRDGDLTVEHVWFRTERDPDAVVAGVLVTAASTTTEAPAVVLYEDGTEELPERSDEVAELAREHGAALVFDPRSVGAVRNREIPIPAWADAYDGIYGTEFKLASDALMLESSLLGMRTFDARRAAEFLREQTGADQVSFVGDGVGAYHALYAAAITDDVDAVTLRGLEYTFRDLATAPEPPFEPRLTAFGVLGSCDVPRVTAALDQRGVDVER